MLRKHECGRVRRLLWDFAYRRLPRGHADRVEKHLRRCAACREEMAEVERTAGMMVAYRERTAATEENDWLVVRTQIEALQAGARARPVLPRTWTALGGAALAALLLLLLAGEGRNVPLPPGPPPQQIALWRETGRSTQPAVEATNTERQAPTAAGSTKLAGIQAGRDSVSSDSAAQPHQTARRHHRRHRARRESMHEAPVQLAQTFGPPAPAFGPPAPVDSEDVSYGDRETASACYSVDGDRPDPEACRPTSLVLGSVIDLTQDAGPRNLVVDTIDLRAGSALSEPAGTRVASLDSERREQQVW